MILVDTSVWLDAERRSAAALDAIAGLMTRGDLAVSAVTAHELLRSPRLPPAWRDFYLQLFEAVPVLPVGLPEATAAAELHAARRRDAPGDTADALIAGTGFEAGAEVLTSDADFLTLGAGARLLRPS